MSYEEVKQIIDAGGTVTEEYMRLWGRWELFHGINTNLTERLTNAVLDDGDPANIADLWALAVAGEGRTPVDEASVRNNVRGAIEAAMNLEYQVTAEDNYEIIRKRFNTTADAFTKAHSIVSAKTDAGTLVTAAEKTRKAWADGQAHAAGLTGLVPLLVLAAQLAGRGFTNPNTPIGMLLDTDGLHRRRVWEAYEEGWTALIELGATIHAKPLDQIVEYREPKPIETQHVRAGHGWRPVEVDPEDVDYNPHAEQPRFASL